MPMFICPECKGKFRNDSSPVTFTGYCPLCVKFVTIDAPEGGAPPPLSQPERSSITKNTQSGNNSILEIFETNENRWRQTKLVAFICITIDDAAGPLDRSTAVNIANWFVPGFERVADATVDVVTDVTPSVDDAMRLIAGFCSRKGNADLILVPTAIAMGFYKISIGILTKAPSHREPTGIKINANEGMGQILRVR